VMFLSPAPGLLPCKEKVRHYDQLGDTRMTEREENPPGRNLDPASVLRIEVTTFGIIYGSITGLALLIAMKHAEPRPPETAVIPFGSVLAVTLAKGFARYLRMPLGFVVRSASRNSKSMKIAFRDCVQRPAALPPGERN